MPQSGGQDSYDPEIAADICFLISTTQQGLKEICRSDAKFPIANTFYRWMIDHPELRDLYAGAKQEQLQIIADELIPISDERLITGKFDCVERSKLQIDTRKWLLSKLAPKKYGDKVAHVGSDDGPVQFVFSHVKEEDK